MVHRVIWLAAVYASMQLTFGRIIKMRDIDVEWDSPMSLIKNRLAMKHIHLRPRDRNALMGFQELFDFPRQIDDEKGWPFENIKFNHPIQSPIDVITSNAVTKKLPMLDIIEPSQLQNVKAKFYNSGSNVYIHFQEEPELRPNLVGGPLKEKFIFEQLHFHWGTQDDWGSEHFVDGESYAVEVHAVYYNSKYTSYDTAHDKEDGLAVLTIFAEARDESNPLLEPLQKLLPNVTLAHTSVLMDCTEAIQWAASALSINKEYYTYPGSLTTKPYSENVVFIILPEPITLSHDQLKEFRTIEDDYKTCIEDNKRQLQPLHNRPIVRGTSLQ